jgi:hypothetical protein
MGAYANDATAANNTSVNSIAIAGSSTPANLDNALREAFAQLKQLSLDLGGNTAGGSADVLTLALNDTVLAAYHDKLIFAFIAASDNATTSPTLNVNGIGAKTIKKSSAGVETALAAGDIQAGGLYLARYRSAWATAAGAWHLVDLNSNATSPLTSSDIGVTVQGYDADTLKADVSDTLTVGFNATEYAAGTKSSGTFTPDPANGNFQTATNGGAHTLAVPASTCSICIQYTNNSSAGAITTSGYSKVTGSTISTTSGDDFLFFITKIGTFSHLHVQALQ